MILIQRFLWQNGVTATKFKNIFYLFRAMKYNAKHKIRNLGIDFYGILIKF